MAVGERVDVLPVQLENLRHKLAASAPVTLYQRDSTRLGFGDSLYDQAVIFFLLHEQPELVRRQTLAEALRVVRPGGKLVIVDYHLPGKLHPLRYLFRPVLRALEPFALDLWYHDIAEWSPEGARLARIRKQTFCGGLYQKLVITVIAIVWLLLAAAFNGSSTPAFEPRAALTGLAYGWSWLLSLWPISMFLAVIWTIFSGAEYFWKAWPLLSGKLTPEVIE